MLGSPIVYLDSSDYSALSDPNKPSAEMDRLRAELLAIAASGAVRFAYSGAHLSEMAPVAGRAQAAAEARADLLAELCGRNAFVSMDRLMRWELAGAFGLGREGDEASLLSTNGEWFPDMGAMFPSSAAPAAARALRETLTESGLPREQRRKMARKLQKRGQPTKLFRSIARGPEDDAAGAGLLDLYPMRPDDANVLGRYVVGDASAEEADAAFLSSLRDPRWMMRWFDKRACQLGAVGDWLRGPSRQTAATFKEIAATIASIHPDRAESMRTAVGLHFGEPSRDQLLANVARRLFQSYFPEAEAAPIVGAETVAHACPGLAVAIRCLHGVLRESLGDAPRAPKESDFVDAAHAMYAPRVALFRADRHMAAHVRRHLPAGSAVVVPRLGELLDALRQIIR